MNYIQSTKCDRLCILMMNFCFELETEFLLHTFLQESCTRPRLKEPLKRRRACHVSWKRQTCSRGVLAKFTEWQTAAEGLLDGYLKGDIILSDFAQEVAQPQATKKQQDSQQGLKSGQQAQQADTSPAKPSTLNEAAGGDAPSRVLTTGRAV